MVFNTTLDRHVNGILTNGENGLPFNTTLDRHVNGILTNVENGIPFNTTLDRHRTAIRVYRSRVILLIH